MDTCLLTYLVFCLITILIKLGAISTVFNKLRRSFLLICSEPIWVIKINSYILSSAYLCARNYTWHWKHIMVFILPNHLME